jgi:hypothetical protein
MNPGILYPIISDAPILFGTLFEEDVRGMSGEC